eukprot:NODE_43_length_28809_cov_0.237200.p9 type:complete len:431 gc:universal NODE_43_length_28809_cov_0.237200:28611-27319(-)
MTSKDIRLRGKSPAASTRLTRKIFSIPAEYDEYIYTKSIKRTSETKNEVLSSPQSLPAAVVEEDIRVAQPNVIKDFVKADLAPVPNVSASPNLTQPTPSILTFIYSIKDFIINFMLSSFASKFDVLIQNYDTLKLENKELKNKLSDLEKSHQIQVKIIENEKETQKNQINDFKKVFHRLSEIELQMHLYDEKQTEAEKANSITDTLIASINDRLSGIDPVLRNQIKSFKSFQSDVTQKISDLNENLLNTSSKNQQEISLLSQGLHAFTQSIDKDQNILLDQIKINKKAISSNISNISGNNAKLNSVPNNLEIVKSELVDLMNHNKSEFAEQLQSISDENKLLLLSIKENKDSQISMISNLTAEIDDLKLINSKVIDYQSIIRQQQDNLKKLQQELNVRQEIDALPVTAQRNFKSGTEEEVKIIADLSDHE